MDRRAPHTIALATAFALIATAVLVSLSGCGLSGRGASGSGPGSSASSGSVPATATQPSTTATPTMPLAGKVLPPPAGAYLGVYVPPAPFDMPPIDDFRRRVGKDVSIVMWYQPWALDNRARFDSAACLAVMRRGKVPMITWEPWDPGNNANLVKNPSKQPDYRLSEINSGVYDDHIRQWARDIRALGGPVMLRPMHEMNGDWYPWSGTANGNKPAEFVKAWRRIHDIFEAEGTTNVTWVWSINHESVPNDTANRYAAYYPGDSYVDWTAISGFNFGGSSSYSTWRMFDHWYTPPLKYLKTLNKPICVAEFASVEQGGDKGAWITDAYKRIRATPQIKAVIYYDALETGGSSTQDWRVGTSAKSLTAFKNAVAPDYFVAAPAAALTAWGNSVQPDDWAYLATLSPIY